MGWSFGGWHSGDGYLGMLLHAELGVTGGNNVFCGLINTIPVVITYYSREVPDMNTVSWNPLSVSKAVM